MIKEMVTADEIVKLYESSGYPSSKQFYKILQKEKIPVRLKEVIEFVKSQSTRQISRPGPSSMCLKLRLVHKTGSNANSSTFLETSNTLH